MSDINEYSSRGIESIIANRIKEAEQLELPEFAEGLYSKMRQWAYQLDRLGMDWVGSQYIKTVKKDDCEIEVITCENKAYSISEYDKKKGTDNWEYDYDRDTDITISKISIIVDGKTVFTTTMTDTTRWGDYGPSSKTSTSGVLCYIPGQWIEDIKTLWLNIKTAEDERAKSKHKASLENPEKIKELKSKWGI